jgi:N-methylhydantoinase B
VLAGRRPDTGEDIIICAPSTGGWGAGRGKDGENAQFCVSDGETYNIPIEVTEARYGVHMTEYSLRADGAGIGEYRGGSGAIRGYKVLGDNHFFTGTFGRHKFLPWGLSGGGQGSRNEFEIIREDGSVAGVFGKYSRFPMHKGDTVRLITGTGGGYGNPLDRPPEKVARDVKNGYITAEQAEGDYGVIVNSKFEIEGLAKSRIDNASAKIAES